MGADFDSTTIRAKNEQELRNAYAAVQRDCAWEHGHGGYTGTFAEAAPGLTIQRGIWNYEEAVTHCEDNHPKWEAAWAYNLGNGKWFVGAWCSS